MLTKVCITCKECLPLTDEYFFKAPKNNDGFMGNCKKCRAKITKSYYEKEKAKILEQMKNYREQNKEAVYLAKREWEKKNLDYMKQYHKEYQIENKDRIKSIKQTYNQNNRNKLREVHQKWRDNNKEKIYEQSIKRKEYTKQWKKLNKDRVNTLNQIRRNARKGTKAEIDIDKWDKIKKIFDNKCAYCGCESELLTQEHFIPLKNKGEYTHNNIIPACKHCNYSKRERDFFDWYPKQKFYSKKREQKILKHLNYNENKFQQLSISL
jgi:hypothetical protein